MCHIDPCPPPVPVYHRHHYRRRRRCPLVGWKKSFFSILARISAAAALPSVSLPLPKLRSSPRRKGIRVRRPTDGSTACPRRITTWPPRPRPQPNAFADTEGDLPFPHSPTPPPSPSNMPSK